MKGSVDIVYFVDGQEIQIECKNQYPFAIEGPYVTVAQIAEMLAKEHSQGIRPNPRIPAPGQPIILRNLAVHHTGDQAQPHATTMKRRVTLPPGARLSAAARAVLTPPAYRRHVMVAVSEMQAEYIEEVASGNEWKARWVSLRGHVLILWTLVRAALPARVRAFLSG